VVGSTRTRSLSLGSGLLLRALALFSQKASFRRGGGVEVVSSEWDLSGLWNWKLKGVELEIVKGVELEIVSSKWGLSGPV